MKITLINPNCNNAEGINKATIEPALGTLYLASFLNSKGYHSAIIDANILNLNNQEILDRIDKDTKIIGVSFNIVSAIGVSELAKSLREAFPGSVLIGGGPHPTALPEECLRRSPFDALCIGEGEETLLEVVRRVERGETNCFEKVEGICYRQGDRIIKNPPRQLIDNLDQVSFPDFSLVPDLVKYKTRSRARPVAPLLISRGCPYRCVYCNKSVFRGIYRLRSIDNVMAEIEELARRFKVKQLDIMDDNLTVNINYAHQLFDEILKQNHKLHINFQAGIRGDLLDEDLIRKMSRAGVFKVSVGVESGDQEVQKRIRKNLDLDKVVESTRLFKKYKVVVYGNFMLGLPGDTASSMQRTIDFAIRMNPDIANFMITMPLPGTELYQLIAQEGRFLEDLSRGSNYGYYGSRVYYELEGMDKDTVLKYYRKSYRAFYFRPRKALDIISGVNSFNEIRWIMNAVNEVAKGIIKQGKK